MTDDKKLKHYCSCGHYIFDHVSENNLKFCAETRAPVNDFLEACSKCECVSCDLYVEAPTGRGHKEFMTEKDRLIRKLKLKRA